MPSQDLELGQVSEPSSEPAPTLCSASEQPAAPISEGFIGLTAKIAADPDKSTTIYRRFDALSARNLLFYQAELAELEERQNQYDKEDRKARDQLNQASIECQHDWETFANYAKEVGRERSKMELAMKIRTTLEKYHEALSAHQRLLNSPPPSTTTVKAMQNWFKDPTGKKDPNNCIPQLWGASEHTYSDPHDLVALRVPVDQDRLSDFIQKNFGVFFKTSHGSGGGAQILISHATLSMFSTILSLILASILLFGAIISLSIIGSKPVLLGMLCFWTVLFAACVGLLTDAKRDQVFAATAAYAAVLVVFISGNLGGGGGGGGSCACPPAPS
ncbi:uncharacterized protein BP5553_10386 [Venustampulla echinocandica]|uniref:DUF6594 domain-containing protein n=1 Tax=Venustampulla echinocandica TaxID=2656787 RepID=A0A370T969_9HELO|nr:uncharacterized protein BP5553_10386 [Venustampulla echinocandica]RDL30108.1 hypothetical protein BP5553_10386 [Venustampulla echinocandica]